MSNLWIWKILQTLWVWSKLIQKEYNKANYSNQTAVYRQPYFVVYFMEYWESVLQKRKKLPTWFCWWTRFGNYCLGTQNLKLSFDPLFATELYKDQDCLSLGLAFSKIICSNLCQILDDLCVHRTASSFTALSFAPEKLVNNLKVCVLKRKYQHTHACTHTHNFRQLNK